MRIRFGKLTVLQHGHRPPADVVIEPADRLLHDRVRIGAGKIPGKIPGLVAGQKGLRCRHQKEGPLQATHRLMLQKITMKRPVGCQQPGEEQVDHRPGLRGIPKGSLGRRERLQPLGQQRRHPRRGIGPLRYRSGGGVAGHSRLDGLKKGVHRTPDGRIEGPGGEVQIPQHDGRRIARSAAVRIGLRMVSGIGGGVLPHRHIASLFQACPGAARASGIAPEVLQFSSFAGHDFVG
jgi:hypothetical protein